MKKCINFEISKKLNELSLLDNRDTEYEYFYCNNKKDFCIQKRLNHLSTRGFKTLTLEEAIDFLPKYTHLWINYNNEYCLDNKSIIKNYTNIRGKTLLESIEKMLEYLLNNGLLKKN